MSGVRTYFLYSDEGLVAEYDAQGNELRSYGYRPDSTWGTDPLWLKENGAYYWYQNDHLGTPQKLVDSAGVVVWSATYSTFGEATISIETVTNNLRFPGQFFDIETGWHYNWRRFYDSNIGRYLRIDPIRFKGGDINLYAYAWNQPMNLIDPHGLSIEIMGEAENQEYTLEQLRKFIYGELSLDENGELSRVPSDNDGDIESHIDELIASENPYRIFDHLHPEGHGRSETVPKRCESGICGGDIYFDPEVDANYICFWGVAPFTPAAELAHELLGRATQMERRIPHGRAGTETRKRSNKRAIEMANPAFKRMGMKKRTRY